MNSATFVGRLTANPIIDYVGENNTPRLRFSIAYKNNTGRKVNYLPVVVLGPIAETHAKHLRKGRSVTLLNCEVDVTVYEKNGENRTYVQLIPGYIHYGELSHQEQ